MFKLLDNPPPYKEGNVFSIVLEVAWYALKQNMLKNDVDLETLKFRLIKKLLEKNIEDEKIYALLEFINIYLPFENPENDLIFGQKLDKIIDKDNIMEAISIRDYIIQKYEAQAERRVKRVENKLKKVENQAKVAESQAKAAENRLNEEYKNISKAILQLHAKGFDTKTIADILSKPLTFVLDVLDKQLDSNASA